MKPNLILLTLTLAMLALVGCSTARSVWRTVTDAGDSVIDVAERAQTNIVNTVKTASGK